MAYNILSRIRSQNTLGLKIWKRWSSDATESGKKWAALWGNGDFGRLGLSSPMSKWEPTICKSLQHHQPRSIACGGAHTLILTEQGRVFATGLNDFGQLGVPFETKYTQEPIEVVGLPEGISQIFAGYYHSSAISGNGDLYTWGSSEYGCLASPSENLKGFHADGNTQLLFLGLGSDFDYLKPAKISFDQNVKALQISCGFNHTAAILEEA